MERTKLVFIIYEEGIRPDVMELLEKQGIPYYTRWTENEGVGETGPKHGDPIWPGLNDVMMIAVAESAVEPLIKAMHALRDSYPVTPGMRFIISDAVFV